MGSQANLCHMLNAPDELECLSCKVSFSTYLDDYDIHGDHTNPEPGKWVLSVHCPHCETAMKLEITLKTRARLTLREAECPG